MSHPLDITAEKILKEFATPESRFMLQNFTPPAHVGEAQALYYQAKEAGHQSASLLKLKIQIFQFLMGGLRDFDQAAGVLKDILTDLEQGVTLDPYDTALLKINQGFFESCTSLNWEEAIRYMREGLEILDTLENHEDEKLRAIVNLIQYHCMQGELEKAAAYVKRGEDLCAHVQGTIYPCFFFYAQSLFLNDQGKFDEALRVLEKTKDYPALEVGHPAITHAIAFQRIWALLRQEKWQDALDGVEAAEGPVKQFYRDRPNPAMAHLSLLKGLILTHQKGATPEAFQCLAEAETFYHAQENHRNPARLHFALGEYYKAQGDLEKARAEYQRSEAIYRALLKVYAGSDIEMLSQALAQV